MYSRSITRRESAVEAHLVRRVMLAGGAAFKVAGGGKAGMPDRLIIWPGGRAEWVEVKAASGRLSPRQLARIDELRSLGQAVTVVTGVEDVDKFMDRDRRNNDVN